ncbi:MAG TPA: ribbon-helix-helix protein, CopG family [Geminicoccaceae bacterium]|nr:ribbon-helix-helix protein, CopG family [Geminicoccaceae bacterium]
MGAARRITISLPEETARRLDEAAVRRGCSRSELIQDALAWHLRLQSLPIEEPSPEERAALAAGRAQHARGDFVTLSEIRRELAADLLAKRPKKSAKAAS